MLDIILKNNVKDSCVNHVVLPAGGALTYITNLSCVWLYPSHMLESKDMSWRCIVKSGL